MRTQLKNRTANGCRLNKMNDNTYAMRRKVMDVIYEAKRRGYDLPRIEVRIVNGGKEEVCGYAYLGKNIVHMKQEYINIHPAQFIHVVLHEIVHAVTGFRHDDNCHLMNPYVPTIKEADTDKAWTAFNKYLG
jgi:hypothetical protein